MRYNQLTFHKANPFYKQDFLPDRAWYNRKPKEYPSEIPTGQQYFVEVGRRHYNNRFNHSEIEETGVLKSPEKYPYQNRIALDKEYMRSLDTTDIEGAGSGTRVNQAIRYKLRAQEQLARKYNQSLDMREHKEHQYEEKRRLLAMRNIEKIQEKQMRKEGQILQNSRLSENPQTSRVEETHKYTQNQHQYTQETNNRPSYQEPNNVQNFQTPTYGQRYINLLPKPYYANLQSSPKQPQYTHKYLQPQPKTIQTERQSEPKAPTQKQQQKSKQNEYSGTARRQEKQPQKPNPLLNHNDRYFMSSTAANNYQREVQRKREQYMRTIEMEQQTRQKLQDKSQFRKHNPTNLSLSLAGQTIVGPSSRC